MEFVKYVAAKEPQKITVNSDLCKGCGLCVKFCPKGVMREGTALNSLGYHGVVAIAEKCTGCGNCFYICPEPGAISVQRSSNLPQKKVA